jgi:(p)ppGpp synthase/HD superfamily hydrolase
MTTEQTHYLGGMHLAPYIQVATMLIGKSRLAGGNMFRHQIDTLGILIDYGYIDQILLKASVVHDILEDIPDFNHNILLSVDSDSHAVFELVQEVSKRYGETKSEFLLRIRESGSRNAKILKVADRISNMISLGFVNNLDFVERYINETEQYILPIADEVSQYMVTELGDLIKSRRNYLKGFSMFLTSSQETSFMGFI